MDAMEDLCRDRFEAFGTAGTRIEDQGDRDGRHGGKRYASGALDPQTTTAKAA
jgi:fructose-bisphosphate aldolase class II